MSSTDLGLCTCKSMSDNECDSPIIGVEAAMEGFGTPGAVESPYPLSTQLSSIASAITSPGISIVADDPPLHVLEPFVEPNTSLSLNETVNQHLDVNLEILRQALLRRPSVAGLELARHFMREKNDALEQVRLLTEELNHTRRMMANYKILLEICHSGDSVETRLSSFTFDIGSLVLSFFLHFSLVYYRLAINAIQVVYDWLVRPVDQQAGIESAPEIQQTHIATTATEDTFESLLGPANGDHNDGHHEPGVQVDANDTAQPIHLFSHEFFSLPPPKA